jgi:hypothetical protein
MLHPWALPYVKAHLPPGRAYDGYLAEAINSHFAAAGGQVQRGLVQAGLAVLFITIFLTRIYISSLKIPSS